MSKSFNLLALIWLTYLLASDVASAANILVLYCHGSWSHVLSMAPYFQKLATSGHQVTLLQTGPDAKPHNFGKNVSVEIWQLEESPDLSGTVKHMIWKSRTHGYDVVELMALNESHLGEHILYHSKELRNLLNRNWDLLVVDALFTNHGFAIATLLKERHDIPYIIFDTIFVFSFQTTYFGHGGSWSAFPSLTQTIPKDLNDIYRPTSLVNRLTNFLEELSLIYGLETLPYTSYYNTRKLVENDFTFEKFNREGAGVICDGFNHFGHYIPSSNGILNAGAYCSKPKPLPNDLRQFVEDSQSKGTIYIALGSMVTYDTAPKQVTDALFGALNELTDYRIIFTFRSNSKPPSVKKHIKLVKWTPQYDMLSHPQTKLFVSHGGLKSTKEGICAGCPFTFMPIFAEQAHNAKVAASLGFATIISKYELTKESVLQAILEALKNEKYTKNIQKFRAIYLNEGPIQPLDEARIFTEKIIRKKGKNLRHNFVGETLSNTQFFNFDLILSAIVFVYLLS